MPQIISDVIDTYPTRNELAILTMIANGFDNSTPVTQYVFAYRGEQGDFGYLKDQSGKLNDSALNPNIFPSAWAATTAYSLGNYRSPTVANGNLYRCTTAGTSGGTEPTWPTTIGGTVADGSAVWTCEAGPWYLDATTGRRQFRSINSSQIGVAGSMILGSMQWDMSLGDSLIISISGRETFTGLGDERVILANQKSGGTVRGFAVRAGDTFNDLRISINDGTTSLQTGHTKASFGQNPLDGSFRTTTFMIDGQTKKLYGFHDGTAYSQSDMFDAGNPAPYDFDLSTITGSTQQTDESRICLGGQIQTGGALNTPTYQFGAQRIDVICIPRAGLPADLARIAAWFHQRGVTPLPLSYLY